MANPTLTIDVLNVPEMVHGVMQRCADVLREEADAEADPRMARRLREIADQFEVGVRRGQ